MTVNWNFADISRALTKCHPAITTTPVTARLSNATTRIAHPRAPSTGTSDWSLEILSLAATVKDVGLLRCVSRIPLRAQAHDDDVYLDGPGMLKHQGQSHCR